MSKNIKLPESLKYWKIISLINSNDNIETYKVSKKDFDGTVIYAVLKHISVNGDSYSGEKADFIGEEAKFLKNISHSGNQFNYIDIQSVNNPAKQKADLYIITEDLKPLSEIIGNKDFSESEIVDFGIQLSSILERLEAKNIYHGNLTPDNIFVSSDGTYKLGGFSDFESKISDLSFVAPEIYNKKDADFTTDIYSLGLIMYFMCNNGKLPFENGIMSKSDAVQERLSGKQIIAPENGSEKLKSVIVIACQPQNGNRWKNAGNIKNALTSIRGELPGENINSNTTKVIVPEVTDFDGNMFEEYDYEGSEETPSNSESTSLQNGEDAENPFKEESAELKDSTNKQLISEQESDAENEIPSVNAETENTEVPDTSGTDSISLDYPGKSANSDIHSENSDREISSSEENTSVGGEAFDDYELDEIKMLNKSVAEATAYKDYGDYFDEPDAKNYSKTQEAKDNSGESGEIKNEDVNIFEDDFITGSGNNSENSDTGKKSKKNIVIIAVCVVVMLAALGFIAYCIINGLNGGSNNETTSPATSQTETTAKPATVPATTAVSTTQPATAAAKANVTPVVGYGYSYAKKLLEEAGFTVEQGEFKYSFTYDEGYVIAQTPEGNTSADKGTVVTLDISLGKIEEETTAPPTEAPTEKATSSANSQNSSAAKTDSSYIFANSDSAYLSKNDVSESALSNNELNLAVNEIYARRGRIFNDASLARYFNSKTWYTPKYTSEEFSKNVTFNSYEEKNLQLLVDEQKARGRR